MDDCIRTFTVDVNGRQVSVYLGSYYTGWALALAEPTNKNRPIFRKLSMLTVDASFPAPDPYSGDQVFCMLTRLENQGLLEQLVAQHILWHIPIYEMQDSDDALVGVLLDDGEIGHTCLKCTRGFSPRDLKPFELPGEPRLLRCEKCKVARYCNAECQEADVKAHSRDCNLWRTRPHEAAQLMEERRREERKQYMKLHGLKTDEQLARFIEKQERPFDWRHLALVSVIIVLFCIWFARPGDSTYLGQH
ncbi:hypothetical protein EV715DRAFT_291360 [Schizophyllum commune]